MTDFSRLAEPEASRPGEPDWTKASLGVIASNGVDGCVLFHVGAHLDSEINEAGLHSLEDLGLDDAPVGITIWEGKVHGTFHDTVDGREYDSELIGAFRPPTDDEWVAIRAGVCPWDADEWLVKPPVTAAA